MMANRAVLFVNGELPDVTAVRAVLRPGDFTVAVDGGLRHARALGLTPDVLIGDLDSLDESEVRAAQAAGARVIRYPAEKDDTDLELALRLALDEGARTIRLIGALGGRVDHLLGNLALLLNPVLAGVDARIDDGGQEIFVIQREAEIFGRPGEIVSLLPVLGPAEGVATEGLRYPLRSETLYPYRTRGVSNEMLIDRARVRLSGGALYCIHIRAPGHLEELP